MLTVEASYKLQVSDDTDIDELQDTISEVLRSLGIAYVEPLSVTLLSGEEAIP